MNKVMIAGILLVLFFITGILLSHQSKILAPSVPAPSAPIQAAAPASAPTPTPTPIPVPTPIPPAPVAPVKPSALSAGLNVSRMVIAGSIENQQPAGITARFPALQERVYCYLELKDVAKDQRITYVWTYGQERYTSTQQVKKSSRWRTWGYKSLGGRKGDWKVDVLDESGAMLKSAAFQVE